MKCPHCLAENSSTSVFCNQCGQRMIDPFASTSQSGADSTSPSEETPPDPWATPAEASFASTPPSHSDQADSEPASDPWAAPAAASMASSVALGDEPQTDEPHFDEEVDELQSFKLQGHVSLERDGLGQGGETARLARFE